MASTHPPWLCQCHASVPLTRELSSQQFRSVLRHAVTLSFFLFDRGFNAAGVVPSNVSRARQHTANTSNSNNNIWWYGKCRKRHEGRRRESFFSFFRPCCARRCRATMTSRCLRRRTDARNHAPLPLANNNNTHNTTKPPTTPLRSTLSLVLPPWLPPTPATNSTITRFSSLKETNLAQAYQSQERLFMLLSSDPPFRSNTSHWTDSKHCPLVLHSPAPSDQSSIILFQKFTSPLVRPEPVGYRKQTTGK